MQDQITLQLIAEDFKDTIFFDSFNCAICKAARRVFSGPDIFETGRILQIGRKGAVRYIHDNYCNIDFDQDKALAAQHNYDQTVIREIVLTKNAEQ